MIRSANNGQAAHRIRMSREARRSQLLESALLVFVTQGFHAASMDDIAERAGVSKPILYHHFQSKLDLYLAVLDAAVEKIVATTRDALNSTRDNKLRVGAAVNAFYTYVADEHAEFRLVFESDHANEPLVRARVDSVTQECSDLIAHIIHDDTGLSEGASRLLAAGLVGMAQVSARFWLRDASSGEATIDRANAAELVAGLGWRGIGHPEPDEPGQGPFSARP